MIIFVLVVVFIAGCISGAFIYVQIEVFQQNKIISNNQEILNEQKAHLKTLSEVKDIVFGEIGTIRRDNYEKELNEELNRNRDYKN